MPAGNALNGSSFQLAVLVGSAVAGFVVSLLQPAAALVVDALTFVVSAVTLLRLQEKPRASGLPPRSGSC